MPGLGWYLNLPALQFSGYRVQEDGAAAQMVDVDLGYLVVGLDEDHPVAEVFEAGLDRQLDTGELPSIAAHALLARTPEPRP